MNIYEKLAAIQAELKAPKSQYNEFGKYKYRNCEDIFEAAKPMCHKNGAVLILSDEMIFIEGRHYVKATAVLADFEGAQITVTASAREEETKKGMDGSQITGASSSYARKYALGGLFNLDDNRDSDSTNTHDKEPQKTAAAKSVAVKAAAKKPEPSAVAEPQDILTAAQNFTMKSGKNAGKKLAELNDEALTWYANNTENETFKSYCNAILQSRAASDAFIETEADSGDLPW